MTLGRRRVVDRAWRVILPLLIVVAWPTGAPAVRAAGPSRAGLGLGPLWLAPIQRAIPAAKSPLAIAVAQLADGKAAHALAVFAKAASDPNLGGYATLYVGRAQLALDRPADAAVSARELLAAGPTGYLREAALWLATDAAEASKDWATSIHTLQTLLDSQPLSPEKAYLRLGRAALAAGNASLGYVSLAKVYYEHALTPEADEAAADLVKLIGVSPPPSEESLRLDLRRAEQFFGARRYADARKAFASLNGRATDDARALVDLRLAECDYYTRHYAAARDSLRAYLDRVTTSQLEAQFFYFSTLRELGRADEYVSLSRAFVQLNPTSPLAEETLNNLATHYVLLNDDATAAEVLTELYRRFPTGPHADRAAWRSGWWAYKTGDYATCVRVFESAAATFRHDDYRPSWLYWAGRAHARLNERDAAIAAYDQTIADYRNSYYGRQATRERAGLLPLRASRPEPGSVPPARPDPAHQDLPFAIPAVPPPPNAGIIRALLTAGLYDDAIFELRRAELGSGSSPVLEATMAYALNRKGELRLAIGAMRRAYPQFLADRGEELPPEILAVIFPVAHWDLIQKYAAVLKLDPYLMAPLIAQESTFEADAHSSANAWGLMQVVPATGRRYAQQLRIKSFHTARLTDPETNIRIGMAYFADLVKQFGGVVQALAAYNAGEQRVSRWLAERPGVDQDEFIDDIPYPETQAYVRRIVGQADDYRRLYRDLKVAPAISKPGR